jgi:zinc protease
VVSVRMYYKVGSVDEDPSKTGLAHYLEHLLFEDDSHELKYDHIKVIPGTHNAHTSLEHTCFEHDTPSEYLATLLEYQAGLMQSLRVPEALFNRERQVVLNELHDRQNSASARFGEELDGLLYKGSPYARPVIGLAEQIPTITMDEVQEFYQKWYAPKNAVLVIGGFYQKDEVIGLVNRFFDHIPAKAIPQRNLKIALQPFTPNNQIFMRQDAEFGAPQITLVYRVMKTPFGFKKLDMLVSLVEDILSRETFTLTQEIVKAKRSGVAGLSVDEDSFSNGHGTFSIAIIMKSPKWSERRLNNEKNRLLSTLSNIIQTGFSQKDLDKAKIVHRHELMSRMDSMQSMVEYLGESLAHNELLDDIQSYFDLIQSATLAEVNATLRQILGTDQYLTTLMLPLK